MLLINFKNYDIDSTILYENIVKIYFENNYNFELYILPPVIETSLCRTILPPQIKVLAQSVDLTKTPKSTGKISIPKLFQNGVSGFLINHSENHKSFSEIESLLEEAKKYSLVSFVGFSEVSELNSYSDIYPNYFLYEPTELIGNSNTPHSQSVIEMKKEILFKLKNSFPKLKFILGAGIKSENDFEKTYEFEFDGIALSSIIMENDSITDKIEEIFKYEQQYGGKSS